MVFIGTANKVNVPGYVYARSVTSQEALIDLKNDGNLKLKYKELSINEFWIYIKPEYPQLAKRALTILLQFSTSYLCEFGFSALTSIKNNKRERLQTIEEEMRVCLSNIRPRIKNICASHQAQISH